MASEFPELTAWSPELAIVLGSGLGGLVDRLEVLESVAYVEIEALTASTVPSHNGRFVRAKLDGAEVVIAQGRLHLYEGLYARQVAAPIRALAALGARTVLLTNAAGCLNPNFRLGGWMAIRDHLNLMGVSPLFGKPEFVDMTEAYAPCLRQQLLGTEVEVFEGVYAGVPGPQYETPAEIRMLQTLGADAVGMSTVPEAIQARALGMRVAGLSCLTNWGAGISTDELDHDDVVQRGDAAVADLVTLVRALLPSS